MRLLGGACRGMNLATVKGLETRPALARVRNSLFNILMGRLEGARVLDLFAGTGSLGLECLSRGAAHAMFVDSDRKCCEAIRASLGKMRMEERGEVRCEDAFRWGHGSSDEGPRSRVQGQVSTDRLNERPSMGDLGPCTGDPFDLVFIDPPYALYGHPIAGERMVKLAEAVVREVLAPDGLMILEHRNREGLARDPAGAALADRREYGQTILSFYSRAGG